MTCHYRNPNSDTLLACQGLTPLYTEADVANYATRTGEGPNGANAYVYYFVVSCLRVNRQIRPDIPEGPCSKLTPGGHNLALSIGGKVGAVSVGAGASTAASLGLAGLSFGLSLVGLAIGPLVSFFQGLSGAPSARELQTDCAVANTYNGFADQIETALRQGKLSLDDAVTSLQSIHQQLDSTLASLEGYNKPDWAPYSHRKANDALFLFNQEVVYPSLAPGILSKTALILGGGLVAAKVGGLF